MKSMKDFDERQLWIRGSIFRRGLIITFALLLAAAFVDDFYGRWAPAPYSHMLILAPVISVITSEMILREAYLSEPKKEKAFVIFFLFISLFLLIAGVIHFAGGAVFIAEGMLSHDACHLLCGILWFAIPVSYFVALKKRKSAE